MTMHTSGPWELVEVPDEKMISNWHIKIGNYQVSVFPYRYENSPCGKYGGYLNDPEMTANARLMTAAPDLLEVLQVIAADSRWTSGEPLLIQVRAAINKATGA